MVKPLKKSSRNGRFRGHRSRLSGDAHFQLQSQMVLSRRFENCSHLPILFEMNTVEKKLVKVAVTFLYVCNNLCS